MPRTPKRPKPVRLGDLIAYAKGSPTKADPRWYWQIVTPSPGKQLHVDAGRWTREQLLDELARRRTAGDYRPAWQAGSLGELLLRWCEYKVSRPKLARATKRLYIGCGKRLSAAAGDIALARLDLAALQGLQRDLELELAPRTVQLQFTILRQAWNWGRARGITPNRELPAVRLSPARDRVTSDHTPPHADVLAVLEVMPAGWPRLAVELLYATGARVGEVCALLWRDVDLAAGVLTIGHDQKTGSREIPMAPHLVAVLEAAGPGDPSALVVDTGTRHPTRALYGRLRRACARAGVERFTAHGLRRRAVQDLFCAGVDAPTAASLMGHTVETMVHSYAQARQGEGRRQAALVLGRGGSDNVIPFRKRQGS